MNTQANGFLKFSIHLTVVLPFIFYGCLFSIMTNIFCVLIKKNISMESQKAEEVMKKGPWTVEEDEIMINLRIRMVREHSKFTGRKWITESISILALYLKFSNLKSRKHRT